MQIPAVDPHHLNSLMAAPLTPREDQSSTSLAAFEMGKMPSSSTRKENREQKQALTFAKLSECDSGDDDNHLSVLTRLSPTPASVKQKRTRAASPATGVRHARLLVSSIGIKLHVLQCREAMVVFQCCCSPSYAIP